MGNMMMLCLCQNAQGDGLEYDDLRREIETWKKRYVDVQGLQDELMALQDRCSLLRHEVSHSATPAPYYTFSRDTYLEFEEILMKQKTNDQFQSERFVVKNCIRLRHKLSV